MPGKHLCYLRCHNHSELPIPQVVMAVSNSSRARARTVMVSSPVGVMANRVEVEEAVAMASSPASPLGVMASQALVVAMDSSLEATGALVVQPGMALAEAVEVDMAARVAVVATARAVGVTTAPMAEVDLAVEDLEVGTRGLP